MERATAISQGNNEFDGADNKFKAARREDNAFDAACTEEGAVRSRLQRAGNLDWHVTGTVSEREEEKIDRNVEGNCSQPARNHVGGVHGWGNENAPSSAPRTLGIPRGADGRLTQQATKLSVEGGMHQGQGQQLRTYTGR